MHVNIDSCTSPCYNLGMETTQDLNSKQCGCGCGEQVSRRFRPGHDGRLKGRLINQSKDTRWWVREAAVVAMVELGWGHFLDMDVVAQTTVRSRHNGRFVETRHVDSLHGVVTDEGGNSHSHWSCPDTVGKGRWVSVQDHDGWLCGTCVHTHDWSQEVGHSRLHAV